MLLMAGSCVACAYGPTGGPTAPVSAARLPVQRDTLAANAPAFLGAKIAPAQIFTPNRLFAQRANAAFDEIVAADRAIGDAAPDAEFALYGASIRAWQGNDGAALLAEGEHEQTVQFLFEPGGNSPLLIATRETVYVFDNWLLIGAFSASGTPLSPSTYQVADEEAQRLLVRGRTLYRLLTEGDLPTPPQSIASYAPLAQTSIWSPLFYGTLISFDPWYDSYRLRRDSRDRHERWRERRRHDGRYRGVWRGDGRNERRGERQDGRTPGYRPPPHSDQANGAPPTTIRPTRPPQPGTDTEMRHPRLQPVEPETYEADGTAAPALPTRRLRPDDAAPPPRLRPLPDRPRPAPAADSVSAPVIAPPAPVYSAPAPRNDPAPAAAVTAPPPPPPAAAPPPQEPAPPPRRADTPRIAPDGEAANVRPD
jgi:hypothetical protein